ncbi:MAG: ROK family protein [Pyrinomonadaceae bacterium]
MSNNGEGGGDLLGIELSSASIIALSVARGGAVNSQFKAERFTGEDPPARIANFVAEAKERLGSSGPVGIAVPGLIDRTSGHIEFSANIPEHTSLNIKEAVRAATGVDAVIENDANAAAYAEFILGAGRGSSSLFYATIGDGVGGAFILDGKLWHGAAGYAGEFGYVAIDPEGLRLQDMASTANIVRRTRERFNRDSTSSLGRLPEEKIGIAEIVAAADEGDEFARLMLERTGSYVGTAIANVINLLNVECIVIGGEITKAGDIVIDAISARARELAFSRAFDKTIIRSGELGENAAAIGAALIAGNN